MNKHPLDIDPDDPPKDPPDAWMVLFWIGWALVMILTLYSLFK